MKLVDTEVAGPHDIEDAPPHPTPPRPEHRRVAVSFLFTLAVLVGTVVMVYSVFPARHNAIVTMALDEHRRTEQVWQLDHPRADQLDLWAIGLLGGKAPLPTAEALGARQAEVLGRRVAVIRYRIAGTEVTLVVQRARDVAPRRVSRDDGDERVESWRAQKWTMTAVGPAATASAWVPAVGVPHE